MLIKDCKNCGQKFPQYRSTETTCYDCTFDKYKIPKRISRQRTAERGKKTVQWLTVDRPKWFKTHPPNEHGYYECYLKIAPQCPTLMRPNRTTLDHVKPRGSNPSKRSHMKNLKPACYWCNQLKGSKKLSRVRKEYGKKGDAIL